MTDSVIAVSVITRSVALPLADALDVPEWTVATGGDAPWTAQTTVSHDWDYLAFSVNGAEQARIDGDSGWQHVSVTLGAGDHTLRWTYTKDDYDETVYEDLRGCDRYRRPSSAQNRSVEDHPHSHANGLFGSIRSALIVSCVRDLIEGAAV